MTWIKRIGPVELSWRYGIWPLLDVSVLQYGTTSLALSAGGFQSFVDLPVKRKNPRGIIDSRVWGIRITRTGIHFSWGNKFKIIKFKKEKP